MLIHGITVKLYNKTQTGTDTLNRPIYQEEAEDVENVLVEPMSDVEQANAMDMTGRKVTYRLCLPKGDTHDWVDRKVEFFGKTWQTVGDTMEWIDEMVPLSWNKKVQVVRIDGSD